MNPDGNHKTDAEVRCFIAIALDNHARHRLGRVQAAMRSTGIRAGWPSAENFHLTLKFLGNISEQALPGIKTILSEAVGNKSCFTITFNRLGAFPNAGRPRVIWIGPDKTSPGMARLQKDIDSSLNKRLNLAKEKKFSPHITLSRIRNHTNPNLLKKILGTQTGAITIPVNRVHLIKSRLHPSGAVHTPLFSTSLK